MSLIILIITAILEYYQLLVKIRKVFYNKLIEYIKLFTTRNFHNQREIRYAYLLMCLPIIIGCSLLFIVLPQHQILSFFIKLSFFILSIDILAWKINYKNSQNNQEEITFINLFVIRFFAPLIWFLLLPYGIGIFCYLIVTLASVHIKNKGLDIIVYSLVVDKILFYVNIIPYLILYIFVAIAGDFEDVFHYLLSERKNFTKSYYFLDNILHNAILIAVDKEQFKILDERENLEVIDGYSKLASLNTQTKTYIVALLYRIALLFVGIMALLSISHLIGLIS